MVGVELFSLGTLAVFAVFTFYSGVAAGAEVQWLGHATTRITSEAGKVILIDPHLTTNPKTPPEYRKLEALGRIDLILVTHGHGDHSADLLPLAKLTGAKVIAPYEMLNNLLNKRKMLNLHAHLGADMPARYAVSTKGRAYLVKRNLI